VSIEIGWNDPEYERIDDIDDVRKGDVYVATDGSKCSVTELMESADHPLRVEFHGVACMPRRDCFAYALRPVPKLPDKPGLWLDKYDHVWCFDGESLLPLGDCVTGGWDTGHGRLSVRDSTRFAPFRPANVVEA